MFDKLQQLKQMQEIKKALEQERMELEREGVKVVMTGSFEIEELHLNSNLPQERQERILKEVLNDARAQAQQRLAQKFGGMM